MTQMANPKRVLISIPKQLLWQIDDLAYMQRCSRIHLIRQALSAYLGRAFKKLSS